MPVRLWLTDVAALAAVLTLVLAAAWLARRGRWPWGLAARSEPAPRLHRVATLALDPRRRVHLIEADGRAVLILCGGGQDQMIPLPPPPGAAP